MFGLLISLVSGKGRTVTVKQIPRSHPSLGEVEKRYDFYSGLYRQYVTDLLKLCIYVRQLISNRRIAAYMKSRHPEMLERFSEIVFETEGKKLEMRVGEIESSKPFGFATFRTKAAIKDIRWRKL